MRRLRPLHRHVRLPRDSSDERLGEPRSLHKNGRIRQGGRGRTSVLPHQHRDGYLPLLRLPRRKRRPDPAEYRHFASFDPVAIRSGGRRYVQRPFARSRSISREISRAITSTGGDAFTTTFRRTDCTLRSSMPKSSHRHDAYKLIPRLIRAPDPAGSAEMFAEALSK